jgi:galactokinase
MPLEDLIKKTYSTFVHQYGDGGRKVTMVAAPTRIALLGGEYTEAVDGYSLLAAGNRFMVVAAQRRNDKMAVFHSLKYDEKIKSNLTMLKFDRADGWANYPKGVVYLYERTGRKVDGIQMVLHSDMAEDVNQGISSAIEIATGVACNALGNNPLDDATLVKLCQRVETQFMGLRGDYSTPYAIKFAKKDQVVLFDSRTFKPEYAPFDGSRFKLVVIDSGVRKKERDEEFKKRIDLFNQLLLEIRKHVPKIISLRDVPSDLYEDARKKIDILLRKRLDHVIYENQRVRKGKDLLAKGDYAGFGQLMSESHDSLADKMKATCQEVDILTAVIRRQSGCLGSRMAGIGWGGPVVCLVRAAEAETFVERVKAEYKKQVNIYPQAFIEEPQEGAREVESPVVPATP